MPNWCHNTLTVTGPAGALAAFVAAAAERVDEATLERDHAEMQVWGNQEKPSLEDYCAKRRAEQAPLSFASILPMPEGWTPGIDAVPCDLCAGTGRRPFTEAGAERLAAERGVRALAWQGNSEKDLQAHAKRCNGCNGCKGSGERMPFGSEPWYVWNSERWGSKWDANFSGPAIALGSEQSSVGETVAALGRQGGPAAGAVIYKFDTAWSPPVAFCVGASLLHPELTFTLRFGEPGGGFAGEVVVKAGEIVSDTELDVDEVLAPEEMWF